jgi:hypothetical protein
MRCRRTDRWHGLKGRRHSGRRPRGERRNPRRWRRRPVPTGKTIWRRSAEPGGRDHVRGRSGTGHRSMHDTAMAATYFIPLAAPAGLTKRLFAQNLLAFVIAGPCRSCLQATWRCAAPCPCSKKDWSDGSASDRRGVLSDLLQGDGRIAKGDPKCRRRKFQRVSRDNLSINATTTLSRHAFAVM